jgi:hypothetical protein
MPPIREFEIFCGDCRDILPTLPRLADACICDPPYGLKFMGKGWDHGVPGPDFWKAILDACKPGAHLLAFGGSRTFASAPVKGTEPSDQHKSCYSERERVPGTFFNDSGSAARFFYCSKAGRVERFSYLTCNCETVKLCAWLKLDRNQKERTDSTSPEKDTCGEASAENCDCNTSLSGNEQTDPFQKDSPFITPMETSKTTASPISNSSPQPSTSESTEVVSGSEISGSSRAVFAGESFQSLPETFICPPKDGRFTGVVAGATSPLSSGIDRCEGCGCEVRKTMHPTQKPERLMRYLCRLITPPGGTVLDPFMGSGSTGKAAILEARQFLGIELQPEYVQIATARLSHAVKLHQESSAQQNLL